MCISMDSPFIFNALFRIVLLWSAYGMATIVVCIPLLMDCVRKGCEGTDFTIQTVLHTLKRLNNSLFLAVVADRTGYLPLFSKYWLPYHWFIYFISSESNFNPFILKTYMYTCTINKYNVPALDTPVIHLGQLFVLLSTPATWGQTAVESGFRVTRLILKISRFVGTYATIADAIRIPWHVPRLLSHM